MKDLLKKLYIHIILLIKSPSNFPIYHEGLTIFMHINLGGFLKSCLPIKPTPPHVLVDMDKIEW